MNVEAVGEGDRGAVAAGEPDLGEHDRLLPRPGEAGETLQLLAPGGRQLGLAGVGGLLRTGFLLYNTPEEVARLLAALAEIAAPA